MTVQDTNTQDAPATGVVLTDGAAAKVKHLLDQEGRDDLALRVAVQPGGCSGLRYQLFFDERSLEGDELHDFSGVKVVVDRMSGPYLAGAVIDFVDTIEKQGFLRLRRLLPLIRVVRRPLPAFSVACGQHRAAALPAALAANV